MRRKFIAAILSGLTMLYGRAGYADDNPKILEDVPESPQIVLYEAKTSTTLEKLLEGEAIDEMIKSSSGRNILYNLQSRRTECGGFISLKDGVLKMRVFDDPTDEPLKNAMAKIEKRDFSGYDLLMKGLEIRRNSTYTETVAIGMQCYMTSMMNDLLLVKQLNDHKEMRYDAYGATWKSLKPRIELEVIDSMFYNNLTMAKIEAISNEEKILCFYHSHPREAGPSETDLRLSKEDVYYKSFGVNAVIAKITEFQENEKNVEGVHSWVYKNGQMISEKRHLMEKLPPPKRIK
ncbi:MAG TPA: Mov34/MPN/PAD-1 family protein [Candidatus Nanoarchaeia archaeon]|nr:Mov34/MPN/PAD-1 family protein [Candidatus Nanoarchaeia archaeon]